MALDHILRNPIYCGLIRFNEQRFKGEQEALIEESLFTKVQSLRRDRSHGSTKLTRVFLLKGLVRCSDCGSWMTPHYTQKRHKDGSVYRIPYYRCTKTMHFDNSVCQIKHINAESIEHTVVQKLSDLSQNETFLKISVEELNEDLKRKTEPLEREAGQIKKRLEEINEEIGRYVKALGQGKFSIERLENEITRLERDQSALQQKKPAPRLHVAARPAPTTPARHSSRSPVPTISIVGAKPFDDAVEVIQSGPTTFSARPIASRIASGAIAMLAILPFRSLPSTSATDDGIAKSPCVADPSRNGSAPSIPFQAIAASRHSASSQDSSLVPPTLPSPCAPHRPARFLLTFSLACLAVCMHTIPSRRCASRSQ